MDFGFLFSNGDLRLMEGIQTDDVQHQMRNDVARSLVAPTDIHVNAFFGGHLKSEVIAIMPQTLT